MNTDIQAEPASSPSKLVTKANGATEEFSIAKLKKRIEPLLEGLAVEYMSIDTIVDKVAGYAHSGRYNIF